jgi:hypothetical protein
MNNLIEDLKKHFTGSRIRISEAPPLPQTRLAANQRKL